MNRPFAAYQGAEPYVFVCYAHDDTENVYPEIQRLHEGGVRIWYDEGISPGMRWSDELARALSNASLVLFFCTPQSVKSKHCQDEMNFALDEDRPLLVIQDGPVDLPPGLRLRLGAHQSIFKHDLSAEQFADKLTSAIRRRVGTAQPPEPAIRKATQPAGPQIKLAHDPQTKPPPLRTNSICVLPFVNMSGDVEQEYFSDGISEDIITDLSKIPALFVIARNTAFTFKAKSVDVQQVARKLNVSHVLEGSVRKAGGRVRITAQLIDGATGGHVWADRYDRDLTDIFAVQDEVAAKVADALRVKLDTAGPIPGATTKNVEAYNALLKGRALTTYTNDQSGRAAIEHFNRAIALDPDYGAAYGELSIAYALISTFIPLSDIAADWSAAFTRALEINPRDASALAGKAYYLTLTQWDWRRAGELYQQARDVGISSKAAILYGEMYLAPLGRWPEFRAFYTATLESDPYNIDLLWDLAIWSPPRDALAVWDRFLEAQPDSPDAWAGKARAYVALGDNDAARAALDKADIRRMQPYFWNCYVQVLWELGEREAARRLVAELERDAPPGPQSAGLTWCYVAIKETNKSLAGYEAAYRLSPFALLYLRDRANAFLKGQPRYAALLKKVHLDDQSLRDAGLL